MLHLIRRPGDARALAVARSQLDEHEVSLALLGDAAREQVPFPGTVLVVPGRDVPEDATRDPGTGYEAVVDLVFASDRVIAW